MKRIKMAKLTRIRLTLIMLQLTSVTVATIIIIINYNPWIGRIINDAERSGNTSRSLADQIRRLDNEELVIFLMSTATIFVSILGIIGAIRNDAHNNCLLNFYMSTLIIFLFVIFVALCGTLWQLIWKLNARTNNNVLINNDQQTISANGTNITNTQTLSSHHQASWSYIIKSLAVITSSAIVYAVSLKLTRKILESSDDHYLSASELGGSHHNCGMYIGGDGCADNDDLNSEDSCCGNNGIIGHKAIYPPSSLAYPNNNSSRNSHHCCKHSSAIASSKSSLGSQFRTIL